MQSLKGKKIVLTGGAGGIGRCAAEKFAEAGAVLILTDINKRVLDETASGLRKKYKAAVHVKAVNVADRREVEAFARWAVRKFKGIDILINNAGIGASGELIETSLETWKRLMDINFWGPLYHVYAFLPGMIRRGHGHIVNVASGQAFFRLPTWGAYATVKLAIGAFSEILRYEVRKLNIDVTTLYPFMVNTGFYKRIESETFLQKISMRMLPYYSMSPEKVGEILFEAVRTKKGVEMVSLLNTLAKVSRVIPKMTDVIGLAAISLLGKKPSDLRAGVRGKEKGAGSKARRRAA
ncbi:MAG TPA: SDR family NAD(P)-dependent oxidoreductase [bacterium]|nr:SDR family NAD(P)-dependent oxidoreductase [bacterium]